MKHQGSEIAFARGGEAAHFDERLNGNAIETYGCFEQKITKLKARFSDADFCGLAKDLAGILLKHAVAPYHRLQDLMSCVTAPDHITIGNHGKPANDLSVLGQGETSETGYHSAATRADEQLDWLNAQRDE